MFYKKKTYHGVELIDTRPQKEKRKDLVADEVMLPRSATPFIETEPRELTATVYSQEQTSSCVPHGFLTALEYEGLIPVGAISQLRAYRKRANFPNPGSGAVDMWNKILDGQSPLQEAPVTPRMTEAMANAMQLIKGDPLIKPFRYFSFDKLYYYTKNTQDNYRVAVAVASGKAVPIFIFATYDEWAREWVTVRTKGLKGNEAEVSHCVTIIPYGTFVKNGKRWFTIHDSAPFGGYHKRHVEFDEFFMERGFYAGEVFPIEAPVTPPILLPVLPTALCKRGDRGNPVRDLQTYLISNGYLEPQYNTGFYGRLTADAVLWWQLERWDKFDVKIPQLLAWKGEYWGHGSIAIINN